MATRKGAEISLGIKSKFSSNAWRRFKARRRTKKVKHAFEELDEQVNNFDKGYKDIEIKVVNDSVKTRLDIISDTVNSFGYIQSSSQIFLYQSINILIELHESINKLLKKSDVSNAQLKDFTEKFKGLISKIINQLDGESEKFRRESIGRIMLEDKAKLSNYLFEFWQVRQVIKHLRKGVNIADEKSKKIDKYFKQLSKSDPNKHKGLIDKLNKEIIKLEETINNSIERSAKLTRIILVLRERLKEKHLTKIKENLESLEKDKFKILVKKSKLSMKKVNVLEVYKSQTKDIESKIEKDIEQEYAKARALEKRAKSAQGGEMDKSKSFKVINKNKKGEKLDQAA